jgi:ABC-type sulfate transport system permease component
MGAPFILPVIVAVLGLLAIFGRAGWLNAGLEAIGAGTISIYGLTGIVLAHAFLNLPLAVRLICRRGCRCRRSASALPRRWGSRTPTCDGISNVRSCAPSCPGRS